MAVALGQRIATCKAQVVAGLPPAEAGHDHAPLERLVEADPKPRCAVACANHEPVALGQAARADRLGGGLFVAIVVSALVAARVSRPAALLLVPYLGWVAFAAVLNAAYAFENFA